MPQVLCEPHPSLLGIHAPCPIPSADFITSNHAIFSKSKSDLAPRSDVKDDDSHSDFDLSKLASEHSDVHDMFLANPSLIPAVRDALRLVHCKSMPCEQPNVNQFWREVVQHFVSHNEHDEHDDMDPFYVIDIGRIIMQMAKFRKHLPFVQPYYAVKCNPSKVFLSVISALGGSFDCASSKELRDVIEDGHATADEVIFANPCKSVKDLHRAEQMGVRYVTFDNVAEVEKLARHMPNCKAVLRIKTNDTAAVCAFSTKFGASMDDVPILLRRAYELGVQVVGCSFHVGSGNNDPEAYLGSIRNARSVFDQATEMGFEMKLLDLGGGFPGSDPSLGPDGKPTCLSFEEIAAHIRPLLESQFASARIIAEPGRYFSAATHTLAMNVHSTRKVPLPDRFFANFPHSVEALGNDDDAAMEYQFYVNDGLYHSFNCIVFDHSHPTLHLLHPNPSAPLRVATIFGPTCDSLDCILKRQLFPEMQLGDWLFCPDMGSYTRAAGAPFNGFETSRTEYICSVPLAFDF